MTQYNHRFVQFCRAQGRDPAQELANYTQELTVDYTEWNSARWAEFAQQRRPGCSSRNDLIAAGEHDVDEAYDRWLVEFVDSFMGAEP